MRSRKPFRQSHGHQCCDAAIGEDVKCNAQQGPSSGSRIWSSGVRVASSTVTRTAPAYETNGVRRRSDDLQFNMDPVARPNFCWRPNQLPCTPSTDGTNARTWMRHNSRFHRASFARPLAPPEPDAGSASGRRGLGPLRDTQFATPVSQWCGAWPFIEDFR